MEENKYYCPECGAEMYETYDKPALNLTCPKCGCKIATTKWDKIDLDETNYEIYILPKDNPNVDELRIVSKISGKNFIYAKNIICNGLVLFKGNANDVLAKKKILDNNNINYKIEPVFPY